MIQQKVVGVPEAVKDLASGAIVFTKPIQKPVLDTTLERRMAALEQQMDHLAQLLKQIQGQL